MKKNVTPELDKLFEEVGTYRSTKDYRELLSFVRKFRHYAPYNAMLLHIQKPGSTYVASASDWQNRTHKAGLRHALMPHITSGDILPYLYHKLFAAI